MRVLAEGASRHLGQRIIVENRPGAGGTLAMPMLQQARPDGYTLAQLPHPILRVPHMRRVMWHPIRDVTPIIQLSGVTFGVVVAAGTPIKRLEDVFAWAAARPGQLTVATNGVGTTPHVVMAELFERRGLRFVHVPYRGTAEQMNAVASGQVTIGVNSTGFAPHVDSGRLRLLVTFGPRRTNRWPEVPTLQELGHGIVAMSAYGIGGPAGLPQVVVQLLHDAFRLAMHEPPHVAELRRYDQELAYLGPEDYARSMRDIYAAERRYVEQLRAPDQDEP